MPSMDENDLTMRPFRTRRLPFDTALVGSTLDESQYTALILAQHNFLFFLLRGTECRTPGT